MKLFKSIGNLLFEDDGKEKKKVEAKEKVVEAAPVTYSPVQGITTQEFIDHFKKILADENQRNFPGNDFYEFWVMKNAMNSIPLEAQRYQAAFAGMSAAGLSKEKLLSTANNYISIIEREMQEFSDAHKQLYTEQVTKNEKLIQNKEAEIQDLSKRISLLTSEVSDLRVKTMQNSATLDSKNTSFMMAGNAQKEEIQGEINKINQYIN